MLFSAVAHCFVFPTEEWADGYREREEEKRKKATSYHFGDSVALGDFINDVKIVLKGQRKKSKSQKKRASTSDDREPMASDEMKSESIEAADESLQDFNNENAEFITGLATPSPANSKNRQRVDTEGSLESDGDTWGSLARLEQFIANLPPPATAQPSNEIV